MGLRLGLGLGLARLGLARLGLGLGARVAVRARAAPILTLIKAGADRDTAAHHVATLEARPVGGGLVRVRIGVRVLFGFGSGQG